MPLRRNTVGEELIVILFVVCFPPREAVCELIYHRHCAEFTLWVAVNGVALGSAHSAVCSCSVLLRSEMEIHLEPVGFVCLLGSLLRVVW